MIQKSSVNLGIKTLKIDFEGKIETKSLDIDNTDDITNLKCRSNECILVSDSVELRVGKFDPETKNFKITEKKTIPEGFRIIDFDFNSEKIFALSRQNHKMIGFKKPDGYKNEMMLEFSRGDWKYLRSAVSFTKKNFRISSDSKILIWKKNEICLMELGTGLKRASLKPMKVVVVDKTTYEEKDFVLKIGEKKLKFGDVFKGEKPNDDPEKPDKPGKKNKGRSAYFWIFGILILMSLLFVCYFAIKRKGLLKDEYMEEGDKEDSTYRSLDTLSTGGEDESVKLKSS